MPDIMTPQQRHNCMSHIRSKNTRPEVKLRKELFSKGYRYRLNIKDLPGKPDIVLPKYRTCIFVNGCFWHGHTGCVKYVQPKTNSEFWLKKIETNRERDMRDYSFLEAKGWNIIVVWECELAKVTFTNTVDDICHKLGANRDRWMADKADRAKRREEWRSEIRRRREEQDATIKAKATKA